METDVPRVPFWLKSLQVTHELLLSKTCPVFVGMILVCSISITVAVLVFGYSPKSAVSQDIYDRSYVRKGEAWMSFAIFVILVLSAVGGKIGFMHVRPMIASDSSHRVNTPRSRTYMGGLSMMPAWGWKAFVVIFILQCIGKEPQYWEVSLMAIGLAFSSSVFQIGLEFLGQQVAESSFAGQCIITTRSCFAVGVGYAVNLVLRSILASAFATNLWILWPVRLLYTVLVTALMVWVEHKGEAALGTVRATWHPVALRTVEFIIHSGKFVVAWAWKGFLDLVIAGNLIGYTSSPCHDQILISSVETIVLLTAVIVCNWKDFAFELSLVVGGMCIGWCWASVWVKCFYGGGMRQDLGILWIAATIVIVAACLFACLIDWAFKRAEDKMIDQQELDEGKPLFGRHYTRVF